MTNEDRTVRVSILTEVKAEVTLFRGMLLLQEDEKKCACLGSIAHDRCCKDEGSGAALTHISDQLCLNKILHLKSSPCDTSADTDLDAQGLHVHGVLQLTDAPGRRQQSLGGNAAAVDTGPANVMTLHNRCLHTLIPQTLTRS